MSHPVKLLESVLVLILFHKVLERSLSENSILSFKQFEGHSSPLGFSTQTKSFKDETSLGTSYDAKEVRISQEKYLSSCFPLSYQLNSASQAALMGRSAGTC